MSRTVINQDQAFEIRDPVTGTVMNVTLEVIRHEDGTRSARFVGERPNPGGGMLIVNSRIFREGDDEAASAAYQSMKDPSSWEPTMEGDETLTKLYTKYKAAKGKERKKIMKKIKKRKKKVLERTTAATAPLQQQQQHLVAESAVARISSAMTPEQRTAEKRRQARLEAEAAKATTTAEVEALLKVHPLQPAGRMEVDVGAIARPREQVGTKATIRRPRWYQRKADEAARGREYMGNLMAFSEDDQDGGRRSRKRRKRRSRRRTRRSRGRRKRRSRRRRRRSRRRRTRR